MAKLFANSSFATVNVSQAELHNNLYSNISVEDLNEEAHNLSMEMLNDEYTFNRYTDGYDLAIEELENIQAVSGTDLIQNTLRTTVRRLGISTEGYDCIEISTEGMIGKIIDGIKTLIAKIVEFAKTIWDKLLRLLGIRKAQAIKTVSDTEQTVIKLGIALKDDKSYTNKNIGGVLGHTSASIRSNGGGSSNNGGGSSNYANNTSGGNPNWTYGRPAVVGSDVVDPEVLPADSSPSSDIIDTNSTGTAVVVSNIQPINNIKKDIVSKKETSIFEKLTNLLTVKKTTTSQATANRMEVAIDRLCKKFGIWGPDSALSFNYDNASNPIFCKLATITSVFGLPAEAIATENGANQAISIILNHVESYKKAIKTVNELVTKIYSTRGAANQYSDGEELLKIFKDKKGQMQAAFEWAYKAFAQSSTVKPADRAFKNVLDGKTWFFLSLKLSEASITAGTKNGETLGESKLFEYNGQILAESALIANNIEKHIETYLKVKYRFDSKKVASLYNKFDEAAVKVEKAIKEVSGLSNNWTTLETTYGRAEGNYAGLKALGTVLKIFMENMYLHAKLLRSLGDGVNSLVAIEKAYTLAIAAAE